MLTRQRHSALVLLVLTVSGCGARGPALSEVRGKVTLGDEPLVGALVLFTPFEGGAPSAATTDDQGNYSLIYGGGRMGAVPGKHQVKIATYRAADPDADPPVAGNPERVPAKYNVQTNLEASVLETSTEINFFLDTTGEIPQLDREQDPRE